MNSKIGADCEMANIKTTSIQQQQKKTNQVQPIDASDRDISEEVGLDNVGMPC